MENFNFEPSWGHGECKRTFNIPGVVSFSVFELIFLLFIDKKNPLQFQIVDGFSDNSWLEVWCRTVVPGTVVWYAVPVRQRQKKTIWGNATNSIDVVDCGCIFFEFGFVFWLLS